MFICSPWARLDSDRGDPAFGCRGAQSECACSLCKRDRYHHRQQAGQGCLATLVLGYESAFKRERAQQLVIEAPALARHGAFRRTRMLPINIPSANWTHTHSQLLSMWLFR
jgi:hypothetical protein